MLSVEFRIWLVAAILLFAAPVWANHAVLVEGEADFDGDGVVGLAEDTDGDRVFGTIAAALADLGQNGKAIFVERDKDAGRVVIKGDGRDSRGAGNASALITATLHEVNATTTRVDVHTDLSITGKVAQFGRGVIGDVSAKLMGQFADNLQELLASEATTLVGEPIAAADAAEATGSGAGAVDAGPRKIDSPEVEAVDLLDAAGAPVFKRVLPIVPQFAPCDDVVTAIDRRVQKILVTDDSRHLDELYGGISDVVGGDAVPSYSGLRFVELAASLVTKASALAMLAADLGLGQADVAAFGDNHNDISMLSWAGRSFAMANATEDAKEAADTVIGHHDDDAIADQIDALVAESRC